MKKLLALILTVAASTARFDQLLDAINEHNLQKVTLQKEYNATNYEQYRTAAQDAVKQCKNDTMITPIVPLNLLVPNKNSPRLLHLGE